MAVINVKKTHGESSLNAGALVFQKKRHLQRARRTRPARLK